MRAVINGSNPSRQALCSAQSGIMRRVCVRGGMPGWFACAPRSIGGEQKATRAAYAQGPVRYAFWWEKELGGEAGEQEKRARRPRQRRHHRGKAACGV